VTAQIGADDVDVFLEPQPDLLQEMSGIAPELGEMGHVLLEPYGVHSTQRLALSSTGGGGLMLATWPAELKLQAQYLYGRRLATPMIKRALELGWTAVASPHLAFRNAPHTRRLYMRPAIEALDYARRWEDSELSWVGQYEREEVRSRLWPWLKERGYADSGDDSVLDDFIGRYLGNRPAFLRPGLRLKREWDRGAVEAAGGSRGLVTAMRAEVDAILRAAHEPPLPVGENTRDATVAARGNVDVANPDSRTEGIRGATAPLRISRQPIPEKVRNEVWRRDQGCCVDCGSRERLEFDHIVPVSKGGSNTARNIELRCEPCNRRKGARI
jgi:hypothetical protein